MNNAIDEKFVAAIRRVEKRTNVAAYVVLHPDCVSSGRGRIVISYPNDGAGRLYAVAWLPGEAGDTAKHHGHASGYGYDKATAAMVGAAFYDLKAGEMRKLVDQGHDFRHQLEAAGYVVVQAV